MQAESRSKKIRGLETSWLQGGPAEAPILLFCHGFPDGPESFEPQIAHFEDKYQVVAPACRGAVGSEPTRQTTRYGCDATALDILAVLDEVDPDRRRPVLCIGHDIGVAHAWRVARLLQKRCAGLAALNGMTVDQMVRRFRRPRQLAKSWYMFAMQVPGIPETVFRLAPQRALALAHEQGGLPAELRPSEASGERALQSSFPQYRALFREIPSSLSRSRARLRCPLLVLWGDRDGFLLPPRLDEFERDASDVTVRILHGNHWIHREDPETVNRHLTAFIQKSRQEGRL